jgi:hypothetical protein
LSWAEAVAFNARLIAQAKAGVPHAVALVQAFEQADDLRCFGVSFTKDGKRVDPRGFYAAPPDQTKAAP